MFRQRCQQQSAVVLVLVLAALVYWPGLHGPYLFDDYWNLIKVEQWADGEAHWQSALMPHGNSLINSRPVAMASFMLTTHALGVGTFSLKFGNLLAHLMIGVLGFLFLRNALEPGGTKARRQQGNIALALTAIWLLHPMHVSTVLYAVQRMAQLGALFALASVLVYYVARRQLLAGKRRAAALNLFLSFPLVFLLGMFSKQNAAVAPFLCLVVEWAYFRKQSSDKPLLAAFFSLFVALPLLAGVLLLILRPQALLAGYADWDFTPWQRLLTQPRVLFDYIGMWFVPRSPRMGLYTDAFPVSTGLFSPWTTLPALLALLAASVAAIALCKRAPHIAAGWFFFLVAHSVESSFLPLEMYYEHRNYLPSWGLLLMAYGLVRLFLESTSDADGRMPKTFVAITPLVIIALLFATLGRVLVWQQEDSMITQALKYHPESPRLHVDRISKAYRDRNYPEAERSLALLQESPVRRSRLLGAMEAVAIRCARDGRVDANLYAEAIRDAQPVVTVNELHAALLQKESIQQGRCPVAEAPEMARVLAALLEQATSQPDWAENKIALRIVTAELFAVAGDWPSVEKHAKTGWEQRQTLSLGVMLARAWTQTGKLDDAEDLANTLQSMAGQRDDHWKRDIDQIHEIVSAKRSTSLP